ncbi:MAG: hypothetical protein HY791_08860 [Deltaproteobacteria bacterium]|nr:hypothetical protein [Deltaproteobacteria bacterium]
MVLDDVLMERLNLNIPADARERLRSLSKRSGKREGELARELLLGAIEEAERARFIEEMSTAATPELKERLREITAAMELLRGKQG